MKHILSLDIGTTSTRAVIFDSEMKVRGFAQLPLKVSATEEGLVEQDAMEIWDKTMECSRKALKAARLRAGVIAGIGITNQRETSIMWNMSTGKPMAPAIVWQDRRTAGRCKEIDSDRDLARRIRTKTGLVIDPSFSATKMEWLKKNVRNGKSHAFGTVDSWLLWKLTGGKVFATEPSNASRTMLMDIKRGTWDGELLKTFGLEEGELPRILDSEGQFGVTDKKLFGAEIPITGILGDQQAALFSHGPMKDDALAVTYGTGIFAMKHIGTVARPAGSGILTTVAWRRNNRPTDYAYETSALTGGAMLEWFKNELGLVKDVKEFDQLALSVLTTGGVTIVPAFAGLAAPYWDPTARSIIIGLNRGTHRSHICRAAVEALACQTELMARILGEQLGKKISYWRVNGGLARSNVLMQSQADISRVKICRSLQIEATAAGAAMIAGLGAGVWKTWRELSKFAACSKVFTPKRAERGQAYMKQYERAVERARGWVV
ncbi:glycerol kinase [Candidatus Uhrbacteria bacterium]|nr:glycerol kinase [Candidatus Uhrbacteria bacterium]